ncbi:hypothetical protein AXF42_Ash007489 [Apostasia shenzhenica]|uniref:Uncharacterized protein n=1 Tax=Apostasia shenzhenica TaxID=1088818 RepID=A0A2I0A5L5_9ASPA|nr:hypothetical protein AXF42_Ash007489 [Apostasia shenzhenica]
MSFSCLAGVFKKKSGPSNLIRAVHLNGRVELHPVPATAGHVAGGPARGLAVWTVSGLLSPSPTPLRRADRLQPDCLYFILSHADVDAAHADSSMSSLIMLVKRLRAAADRKSHSCSKQTKLLSSGRELWQRLASPTGRRNWAPVLETVLESQSGPNGN